jgi:hypothetical protein
MTQEKINSLSHRALRDHRGELFGRSRENPTGQNHLPEFSEEDLFALAALSARAKDRTLSVLCGLERSGERLAVRKFCKGRANVR